MHQPTTQSFPANTFSLAFHKLYHYHRKRTSTKLAPFLKNTNTKSYFHSLQQPQLYLICNCNHNAVAHHITNHFRPTPTPYVVLTIILPYVNTLLPTPPYHPKLPTSAQLRTSTISSFFHRLAMLPINEISIHKLPSLHGKRIHKASLISIQITKFPR